MNELQDVYLVRNQELFTTEIDDDLVMMDVDQGYYFGLNETAKVIWQLLDRPTPYQQVIHALISRYQVDEAQCATDMDLFIQDMLKHQLIERVDVEEKIN